MNEQTILHLGYYIIETITFVISFLLFSLCTSIDTLIYRRWYNYIEQYYKDKKMSSISKKIITILIAALRFFIDILVILMAFFSWGSLDYLFYTEMASHHIKMPWLSSTSYIAIVYFYKLALAILISQYIFALPLIVIYIVRIVRCKQKSA
jgi:hypothetical protein